MPYQRPTLSQLIQQAKSDIQAHLPGANPFLRYNTEGVLAQAAAGLAHGLHGHVMWLSKQLIPTSADSAWVAQWASIRGITPKQATKANIQIALTGTNGSVVPIHTQWTDSSGDTYDQDAAVTIALGVATISVTATTAGSAGNQANGNLLSLVSPVTGVTSSASVTTTNTTGADTETAQQLLARYLLALRNPVRGGGPGDYVNWALGVSGVTRAWQVPNANGPGTVAVYFVCDGLVPIIQPGLVATVQAALTANAPVTAVPMAYAPTGATLNFNIQLQPVDGGGVPTPNLPAAKAAILAGLAAMFSAYATPVGCTIYLQEINAAIEAAIGVQNFVLVAPASDQIYTTPTMPTLGAVTWS